MSLTSSIIEKFITFHKSVLDLGGGSMMKTLVNLYKNNKGLDKLVVLDKEQKYYGFISLLKAELGIDNIEAIKLDSKKFSYLQNDIIEGIANIDEKFDIIVLSNILHFFKESDRKSILEWCKLKLNNNGILFIRANHSENQSIINSAINKITFENEIRYSDNFDKDYFLLEEEEVRNNLSSLIELKEAYERNHENFSMIFKKENKL